MKNISKLPLLFLSLCLSAFARAQDGVTLLVKTDISCNWKLDGQPMGLLKADDSIVVLVSPGEHVIDAVASDGAATLRTKVEVDKVEKTVDIQLKSQMHTLAEIAKERTAPAPTSTWTDPTTGLMWTGKDNGLDVDWPKAAAYCSKVQLAGYSDWRLPTFEELQGIYDPSVSVRQVFGGGLTQDLHVKGNLKLTGSQWSSSQGDGPGQPWQWAWFFNFGDARRTDIPIGKPAKTFLTFDYSMRALCVRRSG